MEHDRAARLLADLVLGRLPPPERAPLWRHVASCNECQDVLATMQDVRETWHAAYAVVARAHPGADELTAYSIHPDDVAREDLARLAEHLANCPKCAGDAALAREADHATRARSGWRAFVPGLPKQVPVANVLAPALAALAIVLAYPAWHGARDLPALRRELAGAREQLRTRSTPPPPVAWTGGAARVLVLRPALREATAPPRIELPAGAALLPVVLDIPLGALVRRAPATPVSVALLSLPGGHVAWSLASTAGALWDAPNAVVSLLVPTAGLPSGRYRLTLHAQADATPPVTAEFALARSTP